MVEVTVLCPSRILRPRCTEIEKRPSGRRRPLRAVFTKTVLEWSRKKVGRSKRTYTFDRLEDRWIRP